MNEKVLSLRGKIVASIVLVSLLIICAPFFWEKASTERLSLTIPSPPARPHTGYQGFSFYLSAILPHPFAATAALPASAWVLQVADFQDGTAAQAFMQTLIHKGFRAYCDPIQATKGSRTRVFVGPEIRAEDIKRLEAQLAQATLRKSKVVAFDPLSL